MTLPMGRGDTARAAVDGVSLTLGASGEYARKVSLRNSGSNVVHTLVNCDTTRLDTAYGAGRTIPVAASSIWTFEGDVSDIHSIAYRTDTGTCGVYIGAY